MAIVIRAWSKELDSRTWQCVEALDEMKRFLALRPCEVYSESIDGWDLSDDAE